MKNRIKVTSGVILAAAFIFFAALARAEIAVDMGADAYPQRAVANAAARRGASLEKLSEAAGRLAAIKIGDPADAEMLLAGLYAGSMSGEEAPAVYPEAGRDLAVRVITGAPAARAKAAVGELGNAVKGDSAATAPAVSDGADEDAAEEGYTLSRYHGADEADKPTLGGMLLAGMIGMLVVAFFVLIIL